MKIDRITLTHVRVPLVEPFRISNGVVAEKDGIIVSLFAGGVVGRGEASPMAGSFYSSDTPESTWEDLRGRLLPMLKASEAVTVDSVNDLLERAGGNFYARAGIETAVWDLEAQMRGLPLYRLLGVRTSRPVESGLAVGIYPGIPELLKAIERHLVEGYTRVKIKIQPGWDVEPLRAVRKEFGSIPLMVDANGAYRRSDMAHLTSLDAFSLMMLEQPLPGGDLAGHAELQAQIATPVCLDEGAETLEAVHEAIRLRSCRIVNIKIQRAGGLKNARAMHDVCRAAGIPVWAGTMPELGIGGVQAVHLAMLEGFTFPTDVESSRRWFTDDIIRPLIEVQQGRIAVPPGAGSGYRLAEDAMRRYLVQETTV